MTNTQETQDRPGLSRRTLLAGAAAGGAGLAATLVEASPVAAALGSRGPAERAGIFPIKDPGVDNSFELTVPGIGVFGGFQEVSGLTSEVSVVEFRDGSEPDRVIPLPGNTKYSSIKLSRAITPSLDLASWHELVQQGEISQARQDSSLTVFSSEGTPVARYHLENAWPSKVEIETLKASGVELLMESVTVVCEDINRVAL